VEKPLGEVITLQRGFDLPYHQRRAGPIPIVSSAGISGWHDKTPVEGPGVVTGRYGTVGEVFYVDGPYWPHNTTLWVKDFKGSEPRFIYYLLKTIDYSVASSKTGVPGVDRNDLHRILVKVPLRAEQRRIATILGSLDDKIELNRRMNVTLGCVR
jgi:type I restriction enzyme S subunit